MSKVRKHALVAHRDMPVPEFGVGTKLTLVGSDVLKIEYVATGDLDSVSLPAIEISDRADDLWRHTCFEAFVGLHNGYIEFNFSPSRQYAVYRFDAYREGMQPALDLPAPHIYVERGPSRLGLDAWIDLKPFADHDIGEIGLSAVIEETDGTKSYWALAHAPGPPDFHNRDCFIATLPAPDPA